jgi:hypothetical protein
MKMWMRRGWVILVVLVLAACSQGPSPAPKAETDYKLWSPEDMLEVEASGMLLQTQATETFDITLRYNQNVPLFLQGVMNAAKTRWETLLTKGAVGFTGEYTAGSCFADKAFAGAIDDIQVIVGVANIDGPGGILANAGPCAIRLFSNVEDPGIPLVSRIVFDTADIYNASIFSTALHEMAHTLGHGLTWNSLGLIKNSGTSKPLFTGQNAAREYQRLGGTGLVPLEPRTEQHWDEAVFDNELMTPIINLGPNLLSRLTLASLKDMGYSVNLLAADAYLLPWRP